MTTIYLWLSAIMFTVLAVAQAAPPYRDPGVEAFAAALMACLGTLGWVTIFAR